MSAVTNKSKERLHDVDVRQSTGIVRSPLDEIKAIQTLLADVYKDAGDGRTLFRELVQNADDAGARRLQLTVLERGWPHARNRLLRGPALLVANDGAFRDKDREALHKAIGGSKELEVDKVGTFGIGLKSVFHICEAFAYVGARNAEWRAGVVNPWAGTGEDSEVDPLHPDWDEVDAEGLRSAAADLVGGATNFLMLWIPLRRQDHLDRGAAERRYGLGDHCPKPDDPCDWFGRSQPAALLLAQCGHLLTIETERAVGPERLWDRKRLMRVTRQAAGWVGRHRNDIPEVPSRPFEGAIASDRSSWSVVGVEALGSANLRRLRFESDWPQYPLWERGRHSNKPRQALAHAAVTVLRPCIRNAEQLGTRLRWAVFLPLEDNPDAISSGIVEREGSSPAWEIVLHGYFWPSQDRKSIPGVTQDFDSATMRSRWNRTLCEQLVLPLLPTALANAVGEVDEGAARKLLEMVVGSDTLKDRLFFARHRHWLLPILATDGVRWKALDANSCTVLSIPDWNRAPDSVRKQFVAVCEECANEVVFVDNEAPRLAGGLDDWTVDHLDRLLNCISCDAFDSPQCLHWLRSTVTHVLPAEGRRGDPRAVAVARWLVGRIGEGALAPTTRRAHSPQSRRDFREAWRGLCEVLPSTWLFETPVATQPAVAELAARGAFGQGLFPMPFGRRGNESPPQLDQGRLDHALATLARQLGTNDESGRLRHSRLLLAETLLSERDKRPFGSLDGQPLLRAIKLPSDREEAWSIAQLRHQLDNYRVFAGPVSEIADDGGDDARPARLSDPRRAVIELAEALDEALWLTSGDAVASVAEVPLPTPEALAKAVLRAEAFADSKYRTAVIQRLAPAIKDNADVRLAARALLAGRSATVVGAHTELFHYRDENEPALHILLRLLDRPWCAVHWPLIRSLSQDRVDALGVTPTGLDPLHRLLESCLQESVDWTALSDGDALHLLQRLYAAEPGAQRRWRTMPLHRGVDGRRVSFNDRTRRSKVNAPELHLPRELEAEVRLLDPDPDVAHLYDSVPEMDRDGVLRLMLDARHPWAYAEQIVRSICPAEGPVLLPQDDELRNLLRRSHWLPRCDGGGLAPDQVLLAPRELVGAIAGLAPAATFGDNRFPEAIDPRMWATVESVVREILGRLSRERQVQRVADALDSERAANVGGGKWLVMADRDLVDTSLINDALQTTLAGSHPGWTAVHAAANAVGHDAESQDPSDALMALTKSLCGPVRPAKQVELLTGLTRLRPAKDSPGGRLFRRYLECFAASDGFSMHVLREIELPTQDGNWHASLDVARSESGVARRHRLIPELRPILRLGLDDPVPYASGAGRSPNGAELDTLQRYFEPWRGQVPNGAVGAFLSLLGDGLHNSIANLAQKWLGEDVAIELPAELGRHEVSVWVRQIAHGDRVSAVNVIGTRVEMMASADNETLFAVDPVQHPPSHYSALAPLGAFWDITLRDVEPQRRSSSELTRLLGGTVERWASRYLGLNREHVTAWWSRWGEGSQRDLGPVLASIKAHLPLTLQQLDVRDNKPLLEALRETERAQRKREQAPSDDTISRERSALDRLATLIQEPCQQAFLWGRVNELKWSGKSRQYAK